MDAFVTRKKRKQSPTSHDGETVLGADGDDNNESTDVKLALLASLVEDSIDQDVLLDVLLAHDGSVAEASAALQNQSAAALWKKRKRPSGSGGVGGVGYQTSLRAFGHASGDGAGPEPSPAPAGSTTPLAKRGRTLYLYDPVDVDAHTPCTLIHNFLPPETANDLLKEMLAEAATFGPPHKFQLFDRVVQSPHTFGFFIDGGAKGFGGLPEDGQAGQAGQANSDDDNACGIPHHDEYLYNGSRWSDVRASTPQLLRVRPRVQEAVNAAIQTRIATRYPNSQKLRYQNPGPWRPNAAFINCYSGGQENVGWHSDQLTYLGPRAVIGSLSLGVAREFRVRRIVPKDGEEEAEEGSLGAASADASGQISIHLPHNSLLVMHADMQETWKHCVTPAASIDPHPIAGSKRINITYRHYRPEFHPRHTPRCHCGIPTVLRVVQKKRENWGRYFWMCFANNIPGKAGCSFFQWAEFDDDGRPIVRKGDKQKQKVVVQAQAGAKDE